MKDVKQRPGRTGGRSRLNLLFSRSTVARWWVRALDHHGAPAYGDSAVFGVTEVFVFFCFIQPSEFVYNLEDFHGFSGDFVYFRRIFR